MNSILSPLLPSAYNDKAGNIGDMIRTVLYGPSPNFATPALKLPLLAQAGQRFSEKVKPAELATDYFDLNRNMAKLSAHPLRQTFFVSGLTTLCAESESPP